MRLKVFIFSLLLMRMCVGTDSATCAAFPCTEIIAAEPETEVVVPTVTETDCTAKSTEYSTPIIPVTDTTCTSTQTTVTETVISTKTLKECTTTITASTTISYSTFTTVFSVVTAGTTIHTTTTITVTPSTTLTGTIGTDGCYTSQALTLCTEAVEQSEQKTKDVSVFQNISPNKATDSVVIPTKIPDDFIKPGEFYNIESSEEIIV